MLHPENLCFILLSSFVYSLIEIELEADQGWMKKIPTAKALNLGGKELTLYHVYMIIMITISVCFQNRMDFTLSSFLHSASYVFLFILLEDVLWFIFNPYFTIKKYKKEYIWWHASQPWIYGMPLHNYTVIAINLCISYFTGLSDIFYSLIYSGLFIAALTYVSPLYHHFYKFMHRKTQIITYDNLS